MKYAIAYWAGALLLLWAAATWANEYTDTVALFRNAGDSGRFFDHSYGYAVFPTVGKAGWIVGGAHGSGRVFEHGKCVGDTSMNQLSAGWQLGAQAYSQIVFFEDRRAFEEFTRGNFEFGADMNAVAITAAAGGSLGTSGASGSASGGMKDARTVGKYYKGMAVFTIVKGGAMYQVVVAGQKFSYSPAA